MSRPLHPETLAIRTQAARSAYREHALPVYLTSSFVFDDAEQARALFADEIQGNPSGASGRSPGPWTNPCRTGSNHGWVFHLFLRNDHAG